MDGRRHSERRAARGAGIIIRAASGQGTSLVATARKREINRSVAEVAHDLGNTPAVCRASYIDPAVG